MNPEVPSWMLSDYFTLTVIVAAVILALVTCLVEREYWLYLFTKRLRTHFPELTKAECKAIVKSGRAQICKVLLYCRYRRPVPRSSLVLDALYQTPADVLKSVPKRGIRMITGIADFNARLAPFLPNEESRADRTLQELVERATKNMSATLEVRAAANGAVTDIPNRFRKLWQESVLAIYHPDINRALCHAFIR